MSPGQAMSWKQWIVVLLCGWVWGGLGPLVAANKDADLLTARPRRRNCGRNGKA